MTRKLLTAVFALATLLLSGTAALGAAATRDTSPVRWFGFAPPGASVGDVVPGATSTLVRTDSGVGMTIHTSLTPAFGNTANTVWWIVFNNPAACSHGMMGLRCGSDDFGVAAVEASVLFAAGHVVGAEGTADFGAYLQEGDTTGALFGPGLLDARKADVHLIVRNHGVPIPDLVNEQIGSFGGGCAINTCRNIQASPHEAE